MEGTARIPKFEMDDGFVQSSDYEVLLFPESISSAIESCEREKIAVVYLTDDTLNAKTILAMSEEALRKVIDHLEELYFDMKTSV